MPACWISEYLELPAPPDVWIWKGLIPVGGSALLFGTPKVGKSILALGLCEAVADPTITEYLGLPVPMHGPVLYIQLDTPRSLWKSQYLEMVKSTAARTDGGIAIIDREMPDLPKQFDIRIPAHCQWLRDQVDRIKPVLVVVDTLRRMFRGNENESDTAAAVLDAFILATQPAALLYLTHRKKPQQGDTTATVRGSSAIAGAVDALMFLTKSALEIEARSDAEEEMAIFQQDDGRWAVDSSMEDKLSFIASLGDDMSESAKTQAIMDQFGVVARTARRYKKHLKAHRPFRGGGKVH